MLDVLLLGAPHGKGAGRAVSFGGRTRVVTPSKTRHWMVGAALMFGDAWPFAPLDRPVALHIEAVMPRPKRLLRKKDPPGRLWCPTKPDWDNIGKAVGDALTAAGVLRDDVLVVDAQVRTLYAARDEGPSVRVLLFDVGEAPAPIEALCHG